MIQHIKCTACGNTYQLKRNIPAGTKVRCYVCKNIWEPKDLIVHYSTYEDDVINSLEQGKKKYSYKSAMIILFTIFALGISLLLINNDKKYFAVFENSITTISDDKYFTCKIFNTDIQERKITNIKLIFDGYTIEKNVNISIPSNKTFNFKQKIRNKTQKIPQVMIN